MKPTHRTLVGALVAALAGVPASAFAQGSEPGAPLGTARAAIVERVAVDSFLALVPPRAHGAIEADLDASRAAEREAVDRRGRADETRRRTRDSLDAQVRELDRSRDAIRIARELEQESREEALRNERGLRERYRNLLTVRIEALGQEVVTAEQEARHARAVAERYEAERRLADARLEWHRLHAEATVVTDAEKRRSRQAERVQARLKEYFEACRDEQREMEKLAAARRELAERELAVLEQRRHMFD